MAQKHIVIDARIRRSGTGRYVDRLLWHLQAIDKDNRYTVLIEPDDDWQPKAANFTTLASKYKQFSFSPFEQIGFARQLYKLKADLVHFSMTQQPIFYFGNIVTTTHDLTMFEYARPGRLPKWVHGLRMLGYRFLFWWGHRKSKKIIVPTDYVAKHLAKFQKFTTKKTIVTYEAAELLPGKPLKSKGVRRPFIFHIGSPFPHKNINRLIEAFSELKNSHPDLQLVLVGKQEHHFKKLIKWADDFSCKDDIVYPGRVGDGELKWLFANAEAYVLPSLSEGYGLPGVEAMLLGCPLVSSNATCLPEVYGNGAHYFNPRSVSNMVKAIDEVLSDEKVRKTLIKNGKKQAAKYSWRKMAKQTLNIYEDLLN